MPLRGDLVSVALAINNNGHVVGWSGDSDSAAGLVHHAVIWNPGGNNPIDLGAIGGDGAVAFDINDAGQVVGGEGTLPLINAFLINPRDVSGSGVPDTWYVDDSKTGFNALMTRLESLDGDASSEGFAINNIGHVVGWSGDQYQGMVQHAVIWRLGKTPANLGTLGGTRAVAFGINNAGRVVGYAETNIQNVFHAFLIIPRDVDGDGIVDTWYLDQNNDGVNDLMLDLGTLGHNSYAKDINNNDEVTGWAEIVPNTKNGFLIRPTDTNNDDIPDTWNLDQNGDGQNDLMINLGPVLGDHRVRYPKGPALNDDGAVVGGTGPLARAFYWSNGETMLKSHLQGNPGWNELLAATDINSISQVWLGGQTGGEIVGYGLDSHGDEHAFRLVEVAQYAMRYPAAQLIIGFIPADGPGIIIPLGGGRPSPPPPPFRRRSLLQDMLVGLLLNELAPILTSDLEGRRQLQQTALNMVSREMERLRQSLGRK